MTHPKAITAAITTTAGVLTLSLLAPTSASSAEPASRPAAASSPSRPGAHVETRSALIRADEPGSVRGRAVPADSTSSAIYWSEDGPWGGGSYEQGEDVEIGTTLYPGSTPEVFTAEVERSNNPTDPAHGTWSSVDYWTVTRSATAALSHSYAVPTQTLGAASYRLRILVGSTTFGPTTATDDDGAEFDLQIVAPNTLGDGEDNDDSDDDDTPPPPPGQPTAITLAPSGVHRAKVGTHLDVTGTLTTAAGAPLAGHPVAMQVKATVGPAAAAGEWAQVPGSNTTTDAHGHFTLAVPTYFYGNHTYRAYAPYGTVASTVWAASGSPQSGTIAIPVPYKPKGKAKTYTFLSGSKTKNTESRWNGCAAIPFYLNTSHAPKSALSLVKQSFAKVSAATGLKFYYAGARTYVPWARKNAFDDQPDGITIAWSTPKSVPDLGGGPIGVGGPQYHHDDALDREVNYAGGVVLDRTFKRWKGGFITRNTKAAIGQVLLHEIGHAIGLDHVNDTRQIMYPSQQTITRGRYQAGDLAGLHALGLEAGCA